MKKNAARRSQRGVSMLMLGVVLGIGVILMIPAVKYGVGYFNKSKVQGELTSLGDFRANVVSYGSRIGLFSATTAGTQALINQNFWPQSQVTGGNTVQNQWGGSYTTAVGTIVNLGDSILLTSTGVPAAACTELGTALDGIANVISINGTQVKANGTPSDAATVGTSCGGANGDANTLVLTVAK